MPESTGSNSTFESGSVPGAARDVLVRIELKGGHAHEVVLKEDASELMDLFRAMAWRTQPGGHPGEWYFQLPVDDGRAACSFDSSQIVAVVTRPPVLINVEMPLTPAGVSQDVSESSQTTLLHHPNYAIVDDFLSPDEHRDMLSFALENEAEFKKATVTTNDAGYRHNRVILNFGESPHATAIANRLLVMLPVLMKKLCKEMVALESVECQLTASNDGHYFKSHMDSSADAGVASREVTCVYYFNREPKNYSGGELRIYDTYEQGGQHWAANSYREIEPRDNRLVVFPSDRFHELRPTRCPSGQFGDSRFAVTSWIRKSEQVDPEATFGWGHFHCGVVPVPGS